MPFNGELYTVIGLEIIYFRKGILLGVLHSLLYIVRSCAYLWGWEVLKLHSQMVLSPLFSYLFHHSPPLKYCHWIEVAIMPGKYFNVIIKVTGSVATQERKYSGKTVEHLNFFSIH
jgi:hypothetical protein